MVNTWTSQIHEPHRTAWATWMALPHPNHGAAGTALSWKNHRPLLSLREEEKKGPERKRRNNDHGMFTRRTSGFWLVQWFSAGLTLESTVELIKKTVPGPHPSRFTLKSMEEQPGHLLVPEALQVCGEPFRYRSFLVV